MAAQVRCVDAVIVDEGCCYRVPVARVVAAAMDEEERRLRLVAPNGIVELEALRFVVARLWFAQLSSDSVAS